MQLYGIVNAFLTNISAVAGINDPQLKVSPVGFLRALLENNATTRVTNLAGLQSGQDRTITVRYMNRGLLAQATTIDDCDTPITPAWTSADIGAPYFSKIGMFIADGDLRQYQIEAAQAAAAGTPPTPLMLAMYESILAKANALIQHIDDTLVTAQAANFGVNVVTGNNAAQLVNFGTSMNMTDGIVKLLTDAQANEVNGDLIVVGNGVVTTYDIVNRLKAGVDANGFGRANFSVYNDNRTVAGWGANQFGVFARGEVGFVDFNKNVGNYAGEKGGSYFFTMPIPIELANGELSALVLDAQLKYEDCPIYDDGRKIADRGWKLILSKSYGLYNTPGTAFEVGDPLRGVNGSFRYVGAVESKCIEVKACGDEPIPVDLGDEPIPVDVDFVPELVPITGISTTDNAETIAPLATFDWGATVVVAPSDATFRNLIAYTSSDTGIATVDQYGVVKGVADGTAVITASTIGGFSTSCTITVSNT